MINEEEDFNADFVTVRFSLDGSQAPEVDLGDLTVWEAYALLQRATDALYESLPTPRVLINGTEAY